MGDFLKFASPLIDEATVAAAADVLRSGHITSGVWVERFEAALSRVRSALGARHDHFIGGADRPARSYRELHSPIDRELVLGRFAEGTPEDAAAALDAAYAAWPEWRGTPPAGWAGPTAAWSCPDGTRRPSGRSNDGGRRRPRRGAPWHRNRPCRWTCRDPGRQAGVPERRRGSAPTYFTIA